MGFSYPTIFLSENPTAGLAAYPHHVWTTAKSIDDEQAHVDLEMRQVWIHGSYMSALDKSVLQQALAVQQSLVGDDRLNSITSNAIPSSNDKLRSSTLQWGYHSPLMYWNNSAELIDADMDLLRTINEQKHSSSSLNVVLRPASVFAGKKFARRQLTAADALVITLLNKGEDGAGRKWQNRMQELTHGVCNDCALFPKDGHVTRHQVYEFSFVPLSIQEHVALSFAYGAMALYVLLSFRRMKAFHSRFGIVVTAITQITCCILASFTICGILKINLSMIPQNAYPFVVLVLGVENMFRLIKAVLAYPPTMATEMRIANALGDIGPISVAAATQNLMILALLSTFVSPGVAAFCAFAAIATLFDTFFLLTFFVAVLNVDIRRLELQDAISARHSHSRHKRRLSPAHHTWFDALVQGRLPFSTRMAGTAVTTTFVLSLNYHFFEQKEKASNLRQLLGFVRGDSSGIENVDTFAPPPMNATLTPGEWLLMQDFDTAKEVMKLAKPGADSFVIRLFSPLIVVLGGSDRTDVSGGEEWTHALRSLAIHHFYPVAVAVVFAVAFVAVLMNFLLYNEAGDEDNDIALERLEETLLVQDVGLPHRLDIVKMASSENGHFVTIGLDRTMAISVADRANQVHHTVAVPTTALSSMSWPIHHLAIDDSGEWIACHCSSDGILAYNSATDSTIPTIVQYPDDHPAVLFTFVNLPVSGGSKLYFIVITSGGRLAMSCMEDGQSSGSDISTVPLLGASIVDASGPGRQLLIVTEEAKIASFNWSHGIWAQTNEQSLQVPAKQRILAGPVDLRLYSDLETELVVVTMPKSALFLSSVNLAHVVVFDFERVCSHIERLLIGPAGKCVSCGGIAIRKLAATECSKAKDECVLTTWSIDSDGDTCICLAPKSVSCKGFDQAVEEQHVIGGAEAWSVVRGQAVLGLRKRRQHDNGTISMRRGKPTTSQLRQRRQARQTAPTSDEHWEAYRLSLNGDLETLDLSPDVEERFTRQDTALYVHDAGPAIALDSQSIAVAFGNTVKIVRISRRGPNTQGSASSSLERLSSTSTRVTTRRPR